MISVIVPVFNAEKWLRRCLTSILNQTIISDIEIIVINDGSTDKSEIIIEELVNKNTNIIHKYIPNGGVSKARNIGIQLSNGDYITFVDSDDYLDNDYFEKMLLEMRNNEIDFVCTGFTIEYPDKKIIRKLNKKFVLSESNIIKEFFLQEKIDPRITNKMYKKELINKLFDEKISIAEDKLFLYNYLKGCKKISIVPYSGYYYIINETSVTQKQFSYKNLDSWKVSNYIINDIEQNPELNKYLFWAQSNQVDVACRIYCDIIRNNKIEDFNKEYKILKKCIYDYGFLKKAKYSSLKHFIAYIFIKVNPKLYNFIKYDLKMQYKNKIIKIS